MPRDSRALTRAARRRAAAHADLPYQKARDQVIVIHQLATEEEIPFAAAEAIFDDPLNQVLCERCGWTVGMLRRPRLPRAQAPQTGLRHRFAGGRGGW
jgi:hypothetical protein